MRNNPRRKILKTIWFLLIFTGITYSGLALDELYLFSIDSTEKNTLEIGASKITSIYYFTGKGNIEFDTRFGYFFINQNYIGADYSNSFRDDEIFSINYIKPLNNFLSISAAQNWLKIAGSESSPLDNNERLNGSLGLRLLIDKLALLDVKAGLERNNQIGNISTGPYYSFKGKVDNYDIDGYLMNSELVGEHTSLSYNRKNTDLDFRLNVFKQYDKESNINFSLMYDLLESNDMPNYGVDPGQGVLIENRIQKELRSDLLVNFNIMDIDANISFSLNNINIDRSYNKHLVDNPFTGVFRGRHEFMMSLNAGAAYITDNFLQRLRISVNMRNRDHTIKNKFDINDDDIEDMRSREKRLDDIETSNRLSSETLWEIGRRDTLTMNFSISLIQYDTPSDLDNSENDKLMIIGGIMYAHRFSSILSGRLNLSTLQDHTVNLRSELSASNNWVRTLRLTPSFFLDTKVLKMRPSFEVLANYTIYDYGKLFPGFYSRSKRQVSYRDSIVVFLGKNHSLQSGAIVRYYETGVLYWDEFTETPQIGTFEQFTNLMFVSKLSVRCDYGMGARYYHMLQKTLGGVNKPDVKFTSFGPEAFIRFFGDRVRLSLSGWYEFQYTGNEVRYQPNFFLNTKYRF